MREPGVLPVRRLLAPVSCFSCWVTKLASVSSRSDIFLDSFSSAAISSCRAALCLPALPGFLRCFATAPKYLMTVATFASLPLLPCMYFLAASTSCTSWCRHSFVSIWRGTTSLNGLPTSMKGITASLYLSLFSMTGSKKLRSSKAFHIISLSRFVGWLDGNFTYFHMPFVIGFLFV